MKERLFLHEVRIEMDDTTRAALKSVIRAEDVQISPSGDRLALADLYGNALHIFDVKFAEGRVILSGGFRVTDKNLIMPHGIAWMREDLIAVANRGGTVTFHMLSKTAENTDQVKNIYDMSGNDGHLIETPGSILSRTNGSGLYDLIVCNNYTNWISEHIGRFDWEDGSFEGLDRLILSNRFDLPDGIYLSRDSKTFFLSDHHGKQVLMYDFGDHAIGEPKGWVKNCNYPHGLAEHPVTKTLFIAGAGGRYVFVVPEDGNGWHTQTTPAYAFEVMDQKQFEPTFISPEDGGPKGLSISPDGKFLFVCSEARPLSVWDIDSILTAAGIENKGEIGPLVFPGYNKRLQESTERTIEILRRQFKIEANRSADLHKQLIDMANSESMRLTLPLRLIGKRVKKWLGRSAS